ncbi:MAG: glycosyltransferase family 4 protein [Phocaeicola sp.]
MKEKKYKIVYFMDNLAQKGGIEKVLSTKASYFAEELDYEIHIVLFQSKDLALAYEYSDKILFHFLESPFIQGRSYPIISQLLAIHRAKKYYTKVISAINPDIIIGLGLGMGDYIFPSIAHKLNIPIVREFHYSTIATKKTIDLYPTVMSRFRQHLIFRRMFNSFKTYDHLVLLTKQDLDEGKYKTPCTIIPNVLNSTDYKITSTCDSKRVVSVGSMRNPIKRFDKQIRLWKKINELHPEWKLDIYGDGPERNKLQILINDLGLSESITLHGNVNNISDKYLESSIFTFTSDGEGLPMVIMEAMSCGLPVIAYACSCGPKDAIRDGIDGYVVEMDNERSFVNKLSELIVDDNKRKKMGLSASNRAAEYSIENVIPQWSAFFDKIIDSYTNK